jgi:hypothetical protein
MAPMGEMRLRVSTERPLPSSCCAQSIYLCVVMVVVSVVWLGLPGLLSFLLAGILILANIADDLSPTTRGDGGRCPPLLGRGGDAPDGPHQSIHHSTHLISSRVHYPRSTHKQQEEREGGSEGSPPAASIPREAAAFKKASSSLGAKGEWGRKMAEAHANGNGGGGGGASGMSKKDQKYDRQLRLWGARGQRALMESHILLINAGWCYVCAGWRVGGVGEASRTPRAHVGTGFWLRCMSHMHGRSHGHGAAQEPGAPRCRVSACVPCSGWSGSIRFG